MKILFLTIGDNIRDISSRGIYKDLMRKFRDEMHEVFIAAPIERRYNKKTELISADSFSILLIRTPNITQTNLIEKGIATLLIEYLFLKAFKKYFSKVCFDLILYSTPPITFAKVIQYVKGKDKSLSYLLLKDIFPQNAVDLGLIKKGSLVHKYFRKKEKELYSVSDFIGCMSPANVDYIRNNNPEINQDRLEVNPNCIEPIESFLSNNKKYSILKKYNIPDNTTVFIYGGSLGKPQGIEFLIEVMKCQLNEPDKFFIIAGSGTEYGKIKAWYDKTKPKNVLLLSLLPKSEFDLLMQAGDVGMIFLDSRFTIPNFPSRILSYMEFKLPLIAATDKTTDLGKVIENNNFGLWSESGDLSATILNINKLSKDPVLRKKLGQNGYHFLLDNYTVSNSYETIIKHCTRNKGTQY